MNNEQAETAETEKNVNIMLVELKSCFLAQWPRTGENSFTHFLNYFYSLQSRKNELEAENKLLRDEWERMKYALGLSPDGICSKGCGMPRIANAALSSLKFSPSQK